MDKDVISFLRFYFFIFAREREHRNQGKGQRKRQGSLISRDPDVGLDVGIDPRILGS